FRGGATIHGPVSRSHAYSLPKQIRAQGLKTALSAKQAEGQLFILKETAISQPTTNSLIKQLSSLGWDSVLVVDGTEVNDNFKKAAANIAHVNVLPQQGINVYDILHNQKLVLTEAALKALEERFK